MPDDRWLRETPPSVSAAALPPSALTMTALREGEKRREERGERGKREERREGREERGEWEEGQKGEREGGWESDNLSEHTTPLLHHYPLHLES